MCCEGNRTLITLATHSFNLFICSTFLKCVVVFKTVWHRSSASVLDGRGAEPPLTLMMYTHHKRLELDRGLKNGTSWCCEGVLALPPLQNSFMLCPYRALNQEPSTSQPNPLQTELRVTDSYSSRSLCVDREDPQIRTSSGHCSAVTMVINNLSNPIIIVRIFTVDILTEMASRH